MAPRTWDILISPGFVHVYRPYSSRNLFILQPLVRRRRVATPFSFWPEFPPSVVDRLPAIRMLLIIGRTGTKPVQPPRSPFGVTSCLASARNPFRLGE